MRYKTLENLDVVDKERSTHSNKTNKIMYYNFFLHFATVKFVKSGKLFHKPNDYFSTYVHDYFYYKSLLSVENCHSWLFSSVYPQQASTTIHPRQTTLLTPIITLLTHFSEIMAFSSSTVLLVIGEWTLFSFLFAIQVLHSHR